MVIALYQLGPRDRCAFNFNGSVVNIEEVEIACNPVIPVSLLTPARATSTIEKAKSELVRMFTEHMEAAQDLKPDQACLHILVRTPPTCSSADSPPMDIYDPPAYYDEEEGCMVIPEGAVVTGQTEPAIGWSMFLVVGMVALDATPGPNATLIPGEPLWTTPFKVGRAKRVLVNEVTKTIVLGPRV